MTNEEKRVIAAAVRFARANTMNALQDAEYDAQRSHPDVRVRLAAVAAYDEAHACMVRAELELMDAVAAMGGTEASR